MTVEICSICQRLECYLYQHGYKIWPAFKSATSAAHRKTVVAGVFLLLMSAARGYADAQRSNLVQRLNDMIIPELNYHEAKPSDIFAFLSDESRRLDPEHLGVNIIVQAETDEMRVAISLRNVPLVDAVKFVCVLSGLSYRIEHSGVIVSKTAAAASIDPRDKELFAQRTNEPAFVETLDLDYGSYRGHASITTGTTTVKLGEEYPLAIQFVNDGGSNRFFNPQFNGLLVIPARFPIYDVNKKFIGEFWGAWDGSHRGANEGDWKVIPSGSHFDTTIRVTAGYVVGDGRLPAGEYYLQVIYSKALIDANPWDRRELFRSNVIKMHFVDGSAKGDGSGS